MSSAVVPGVIVLLGGLVMPESPSSLIERGHEEKARTILARIRGTNDIDDEFEDIREAARISNLVPHPMRNLMTALQASAHHFSAVHDVPAVHRYQRHYLLRPSAVQQFGIRTHLSSTEHSHHWSW